MPSRDSMLHVIMLRLFKQKTSTRGRVGAIFRRDPISRKLYGLGWGDPETDEPVQFIRDRYLLTLTSIRNLRSKIFIKKNRMDFPGVPITQSTSCSV